MSDVKIKTPALEKMKKAAQPFTLYLVTRGG